MALWITGLSGAGKTTLANAFIASVRSECLNIVLLDGDAVRSLYGDDLDYVESDRVIQINRLQSLAAFLDKQGIVVVVAALYAHPDLLDWNRERFSSYEVYLDAPMEQLNERDWKGLYRKAREGHMKDVGVDIPAPPQSSDMRVDTTKGDTPDALGGACGEGVRQLERPDDRDSFESGPIPRNGKDRAWRIRAIGRFMTESGFYVGRRTPPPTTDEPFPLQSYWMSTGTRRHARAVVRAWC